MKILLKTTALATVMSVALAGCLSTTHADTIGVNFNNGGATLLDPTDFVGVVPSPNWNNFRNNGGLGLSNPTPTVLNDATGADSGARITWDVGASFFNSNNGTGNQRMMEGWFGLNAGDGGQIVVDGLSAAYTDSGYDAYVYFDSNAVAPDERTMTFTAAGMSLSGKELAVNYPGEFTEASGGSVGNYVVFRGLTDSTFSLTADADMERASINGIQITTELPPTPNDAIHAYNGADAGNTAERWLDPAGGKNWSLAGAELNAVSSPNTTITNAYRLADPGQLVGGDTTPFPGGDITYEMWVRPGQLDANHQVIFETGGGQNGTAIAMTATDVRLLNSTGNARGFDMTVPLDGIDLSDFVQIVASLDATNGEINLYVNGAAGGSDAAVAAGSVGRGGNRASLFTWGSGLGNLGDPMDAGGGTFNLGGRTELADMTPAGLTQFTGDIGLMNAYSRAFTAAEVQQAFGNVFVPEPSSSFLGLLAMLSFVGGLRRRR